jgi:hypothetical protein
MLLLFWRTCPQNWLANLEKGDRERSSLWQSLAGAREGVGFKMKFLLACCWLRVCLVRAICRRKESDSVLVRRANTVWIVMEGKV